VAAQLGGSYLPGHSPEARERLAEALTSIDLAGETVTTRQQFDLWAGFPFLVLFVSLLGAEWFLRRRHGLL
jgi:hypothetical protein